MPEPLFQMIDLRRMARRLAAILLLAGGLVLLLQAYLVDVLPPIGGFKETYAVVSNLERTGTFQEPAFLVTLTYTTIRSDGTNQEIHSGVRVPYEQYRSLRIGDTVQINYNAINVFDWHLVLPNEQGISEYGLGLLMVIIGVMSFSLPVILAWASRQDEFLYSDEEEVAQAGELRIPYGDGKQNT